MPVENAADFYDALAPMFDVMTDWEARLAAEGPFLRATLDAGAARRVLDAACGSGGHALALARWGYDVAGADASPVMVQMAAAKAAEGGIAVPFVTAGLAELPAHFAGRPFDAVLCLGNTLPHLLSDEALAGALRGMAGVLRPGGLLVLQQLNYDLRWRTQPRFFAAQGGVLDGQEVLVWRFADYELSAQQAPEIAFHIALFRKSPSGWDVQVHTTAHRPWFHAALLKTLAQAGFTQVQSFARMTWPAPPFDEASSGDLVLVARKKGD